MEKTKFTPGPWSPVVDTYGMAQQVMAKDGAISVRPICDCHAGGKEERNANARLIAAAPELLVMLQRFYEQTYGKTDIIPPLDFEQAKAAISKALGE